MPRFIDGVIKFQNEVYPDKKELFERLAKGQEPEAVFIACSDARVETAMITQTDPGELFILRNAGNIVPPHTSQTGAMTATIEFAMRVLGTPHIVVCGHSECGAMKGAMNPDSVKHLPHVKEWIGFAQAAVDVVNELATDETSDDEKMRMLLEQNVMLQLQHLKTHPSVLRRLAAGQLTLHGWVYDIKTGEVSAYDEETDTFSPVDDHYAALARELAKKNSCCD
ncbi:carbonic anhydrase [Ponticaulis profundi]|uniref:Carbonic anhydrase n=1 Tax=Ponticaulis profundi TaxID=2665222 RepID=A0ABW1S7Z4_9PROT